MTKLKFSKSSVRDKLDPKNLKLFTNFEPNSKFRTSLTGIKSGRYCVLVIYVLLTWIHSLWTGMAGLYYIKMVLREQSMIA